VFLKPPQVGIRWEQGAVGNAEWTGVALADVLQRAGVRPGSVEVILEGADRGEFREPNPKSPGVISYARSLSLEKANQPEVVLAYQMNGEELPPEHGYPVRAIVPAWYGMSSVKWLKRIIVTDRPFNGYFQTFAYTIWQRRDGLPDLVPVQHIQVKSQIARPVLNEVVPTNSKYRIHGAAWTGDGQVAKVKISTDNGSRWTQARLLGDPVPFAWRMWEYQWSTPTKPGQITLMARATDDRGKVQPMERDDDRRDAVINHVQPIKIELQ
jgi:DMSO/TMAO reductase YedYZ molybdopterin-dependent catalytic subunit